VAHNCIGAFDLVRAPRGWQVPSRGDVWDPSWNWGETPPDIDIQVVIPLAAKWADQNPPDLKHDIWWLKNCGVRLQKEFESFAGRVEALCGAGSVHDRDLARIDRMIKSVARLATQVADSAKERVSVKTPAPRIKSGNRTGSTNDHNGAGVPLAAQA
jgi:hypothetical protein